MRRSGKISLAIGIGLLLTVACPALRAQFDLSWKRIGDVSLYLHGDRNKMERLIFDYNNLYNLYIEVPLKGDRYSIGLDLAYAEYHPLLGSAYDSLGGNGRFYDRSYSAGLSLRRYFLAPWSWRIDKPGRYFKFFAEATVYANYLHIKQPIIIDHAFGRYTRIIDDEYTFVTGSLGAGISWGGRRFSWEPYVQLGFMPAVDDKRANLVAVSSIGMVENNLALFLAPAVFKVLLFNKED